MTSNDLRKAVEILKRNEIPPRVCIRCGEEFYIHNGKDWSSPADLSDIVVWCDCGGELVAKKRAFPL